jgi:hypothetical protein
MKFLLRDLTQSHEMTVFAVVRLQALSVCISKVLRNDNFSQVLLGAAAKLFDDIPMLKLQMAK